MNIIVNRQKSQKDWTLSTFNADDNSFKGVGVEDEKRDIKVFGETRIGAGTYELELVNSPKFSHEYYRDANGNLMLAKDWNLSKPEIKGIFKWKHELIHVKNVANFESILWHWGNTDLDTHGCYIVGSVFRPTQAETKSATLTMSKEQYNEHIQYLNSGGLVSRLIEPEKLTS